MVIDPFENDRGSRWPRWFVRRFPVAAADVVLVTHDHFDHNASHRVPGAPGVVTEPGRRRFGDVEVVGVPDFHARRSGQEGMVNVNFVLEIGGIRFCHLGDNRAAMPEEVVEALGRIDCLTITVDDSCHLLEYDEVDLLISEVSPRVVVPMHYLVPGLTDPGSTLLSPGGWISDKPSVVRKGHTLTMTPETLPSRQEVWVMDVWPGDDG